MLIRETCCVCGVEFGLTEKHYKQLVKCHNYFYCPNGHGQSYVGRTVEEKEIDELQGQLVNMERSRDYYKRQSAKTKKRKK